MTDHGFDNNPFPKSLPSLAFIICAGLLSGFSGNFNPDAVNNPF
jgi:hypothetical protein